MSALTRDEAWARLREAGLAEGQAPPADNALSPWYVRVMLGIAGWIGALFLLGFVGAALAFVFRSPSAGIAVGLIGCVAAYALLRAGGRNDFLLQFALALSLAGQVLFVIGVMEGAWQVGGSKVARLLLVSLFEAGLAIAMPLFIHRVWSAWAASAALAVALGQLSLDSVAPALIAAAAAALWLREYGWGRFASIARPAGYGLALALLQFQGFAAWGLGAAAVMLAERDAQSRDLLISGLLVGLVLCAVAWRLLAREGVPLTSRAAIAAGSAALVVALLGVKMPGLAAAGLLLVLGFANGNRVLLGLGLLGLIGFVSSYYYRLDATLLAKSGYLAAGGIALLLVRAALRRLAAARETGHA